DIDIAAHGTGGTVHRHPRLAEQSNGIDAGHAVRRRAAKIHDGAHVNYGCDQSVGCVAGAVEHKWLDVTGRAEIINFAVRANGNRAPIRQMWQSDGRHPSVAAVGGAGENLILIIVNVVKRTPDDVDVTAPRTGGGI